MPVKFNYREISRAVAKSPVSRKRIETIARKRFDVEREVMLAEFDNDDVTKEIEAGAADPVSAPNITNTLKGSTRGGNLYSFIGFEENPIPPLRAALEQTSLVVSTISAESDGIRCKFSVKVPTEEIQKATPLPFESGKSWAEGIEKGISGFSQYLVGKFGASRSGGGLQSDHKVRTQEFQTVQYLSKILKNFTARLRRK